MLYSTNICLYPYTTQKGVFFDYDQEIVFPLILLSNGGKLCIFSKLCVFSSFS